MAALWSDPDFRGSKHTSFPIWLSATGRLLLEAPCLFHLCQVPLPSPKSQIQPLLLAHLFLLLSCPVPPGYCGIQGDSPFGKGPDPCAELIMEKMPGKSDEGWKGGSSEESQEDRCVCVCV